MHADHDNDRGSLAQLAIRTYYIVSKIFCLYSGTGSQPQHRSHIAPLLLTFNILCQLYYDCNNNKLIFFFLCLRVYYRECSLEKQSTEIQILLCLFALFLC